MFGGKKLLCAVGLTGCLAVVGCVTLGRPPAPAPDLAPKPAPANLNAGPDLRIPGDPVVRTTDIPLVPLPSVRTDAPSAPDAPPPVPPAPPTLSPPPSAPPSPTPPAPARQPLTPLLVYQQAAARYATVDSYIARVTRREFVKGKMQPEEVLLFKFRKEPWSVYFKWLGKEGQGREVAFVKGQHEGKIHTRLAAGDVPFMPAGRRMALAPDNAFVRSASRHPITEAGMGAAIEHLGQVAGAIQRGDRRRGTLTVLPALKRPELEGPVVALEHAIPPGAADTLPRGGRRLFCFDPETNLPVLIQTHDETGQEVEYYRYDRLQLQVRLDNDDFNPDRLWGDPAGRAALSH